MPPVIKVLILTISMLGVMLLFSLSVMIWGIVIMRLRRGKAIEIPDFSAIHPPVEAETIRELPQETDSSVEELTAESESAVEVDAPASPVRELPPLGGLIPPGLLALLWLGMAFLSSAEQSTFQLDQELNRQRILSSLLGTAVMSILLITLLTGLLLMFIRSDREKPVRELLGFSDRRLYEQLLTGVIGFITVLLPVYATIIATMSLRSEESLHPFLQLAKDSPPVIELALIALTAVVLAPVQEELLFRVILQPLFEHFLPAPAAIAIVAALFAAVHQFPDSLSIFPLGLLLGYLFYKTRSYLVVVAVHALFNGFNLSVLLLNTLVFPEIGPTG